MNESRNGSPNEPLAIVGIGCRFPGGANSPIAFWKMLCAGTDAIREVPEDRWSIAAHYDPTAGRASKSISKWGGFIDDIDRFDSAFFGISAREADGMDPQQRLLLEATWEALEDGGLRLEEVRGSRTGVFVGISTSDYADLQSDSVGRNAADVYTATGSTFSIAANRISYSFDLRGPSLAVDTACSSALTACHLACQSIWRGDCSMAVVAGVNALISPDTFIAFSRMSMLSPDGRCKAFDASTNGFVRAEGVGAVILKPLSVALADEDSIYAVIRSTAANQDGRTRGITVPSQDAQEALILEACRAAEIAPAEVAYVEAHGTGTPIGDPIEAVALGAALSEGRRHPCLIGSVKTNIGHLEAASGVASLIKVALVLKHRVIPPSLHFHHPNPNIDFRRLNLRVISELENFPTHSEALFAGINSFGFGGGNAHVILEAAPVIRKRKSSRDEGRSLRPMILPISAHSGEALRTATQNYRALLENEETDLPALCAAAATRRSHHDHRLCVIADSRKEMAQVLEGFLAGETNPNVVAGEVSTSAAPVFVFSGQGPQWWAMGRELIRKEALFRRKIEECDGLLREFGSWSLIEELHRDEVSSRMQETEIAQPAIFALQVALSALWQSWGVHPSAVVGHSVGEVAAAHVAGVLSLREAARVIFHRGRSMNAARENGRMLAVALDADEAKRIAASFPGQVSVAAFNGPNSVALSGDREPLEEIARDLESRGVFNRFLQVNYAFHSHQMDAAKDDLLIALRDVDTASAQLPLFSTVTGTLTNGRNLNADYWWRNVRQPVLFTSAIEGLIDQGHRLFLELSAHPVLAGSVSETLAHRGVTGKVFLSLRRDRAERESMLKNLAALHVAGSPVNWKGLYPASSADTPLPAFPWQRERHWRESSQMRAARLDAPVHPFLTKRLPAAEATWNAWLDLSEYAWLKDHRIHDSILFPGAGYVEAALGIGAAQFNSLPLEVENVEFKKALILPEGKDPVRLQCAFSQADGTVKFSSLAHESSGAWELHASAKLRSGASIHRPAMDLRKLRSALRVPIEKPKVYATCAERGLHYGGMFQAVEQIWRNETSECEALGKIVLPNALAASADQFQIHPSVLDACLQVALFAAPDNHDRTTFLPSRIDRLTLVARPGEIVYCHAKLVQASGQAMMWDFQLADESGRILLTAEGFRAQAVRQASTLRADAPDNWLYETKWIEKPLGAAESLVKARMSGTWLIFADQLGVGAQLATRLEQAGATVRIVKHNDCAGFVDQTLNGTSSSLSSQLECIVSEADGRLEGVIHLWSLDAPETSVLNPHAIAKAEADCCHSLLHLLQNLSRAHAAPSLWLVARGAQAVTPKEGVSVAQAPILGVGRTIQTEFPHVACRMIDIDLADNTEDAQIVFNEIAANDAETEIAWRANVRLASRLAHVALDRIAQRQGATRGASYQLRSPSSGVIDEMALYEIVRRKPGPNEVEIEVHAAALNFRDVMKLLGVYPLESDRDTLLGDECAGRVVRVGRNVQHFAVGDQVIANGAGCFASHLTVPSAFVVRKPASLTFEQAATLPVAFMTAWYALHELGRIQRGERVLIHSGTGGVGLAAIQVAKIAGAEIFATAGSEEKRAYLRKLGIRHVMDSRSTAFAAEIRTLTKGRGVDLVLNSLAGDAIEKSISVLAPGGRFLEIGKRDIYANTSIGLRPFRNNLSMFVIDMGQVMANQPETVQSLLQTMLKLMRQGKLKPLASRSFPITNAAEAFRLMAQAKHVGKIVLSTEGVSVTTRPAVEMKPIAFSPKATYLITGGLGGFGLSVAKWLVERGARNLVLVGRSGASSAESGKAVAGLKRIGAKVLVMKADVANERQVAKMFEQARKKLPPLRGIFHAAMVLDDRPLQHLTPERFTRVMGPKATGAWNLHAASVKLKLDHFVLFSSISALIGTAGQANYSAANCFLDALAQYRRSQGLAALSVNWGALADVGVVARNAGVAAHLAAHGVYGIAPLQATDMLGQLLKREIAQIGFMHVDWQRLFAPSLNANPSPRFSEVFTVDEGITNVEGDVRRRIAAAPQAERRALTAAIVSDSVAKVLRTSTAKLDANRPLREIGLDSLMAIELLNRLESQFKVSLPTNSISSDSNIDSLSELVLAAFDTGMVASGGASLNSKPNGHVKESAASVGSSPKCLITLRASSHGSPLFLIHPAGGTTSIYEALAAELRPGFPVYALQSQMSAGASDEFASVREMASGYADLIMHSSLEGPVRLAGFSAGGLFAHAVARELERRDRVVSLVAMIETPIAMLNPDYPRVSVLQNLIGEVYDQMTGELPPHARNGNGSSHSIVELAERILTAVDDSSRLRLVLDWLPKHGVAIGDNAELSSRQFLAVLIRHAVLIEEARFAPIAAPVWLARARGSWLTRAQRTMTASITSGKITQEILEGRHFKLMQYPLVGELAARLDSALGAATIDVECAGAQEREMVARNGPFNLSKRDADAVLRSC